MPLITLEFTSYNASFGDSAPVKMLRVTYRIDGKPGETFFKEDSLIVLPITR